MLTQADNSESSKSKRRRSATPEEGWDRRDRKRSRYDDDGTKTQHSVYWLFFSEDLARKPHPSLTLLYIKQLFSYWVAW